MNGWEIGLGLDDMVATQMWFLVDTGNVKVPKCEIFDRPDFHDGELGIIWFLMRTLSVHINSWCLYAQRTHQFLTRMLRVHISPCVYLAGFEGTALLNEPRNSCKIFLGYFNSKVALPQRLCACCKNHKYPSDQKSHTWAPLNDLCERPSMCFVYCL